ncbi:MHC class II transactivator isoform X4 [Erinaceus europaeus]|uniref:MHC class II transactivator isoform X4 n=1 Tax=Erinaceus europaeus TaxID=9365 RepID=A0ABM3VVJ7_ERIEU|nr:MHC class II transactivator isoform X4 [Erinaceus europaeus]
MSSHTDLDSSSYWLAGKDGTGTSRFPFLKSPLEAGRAGSQALVPRPQGPQSMATSHFQAVLSRVRVLLSSPGPGRVRALLDHLLEEQLLSREYHRALLHEPDGEALARKIALTLLDRADPDLVLLGWLWTELQAPVLEWEPDDEPCPGSAQCSIMEPAPLERGYLGLLTGSADLWPLSCLCDPLELALEDDLCSESDLDTINCEQLSSLLCDMEHDEENPEAYANIAGLDQYVFEDLQLEGPSRDSLRLEEIIRESMEAPEDSGWRSQKRSFPEEPPEDPKHRKLAEAPAVPVVTGTFLMGPVTDAWTQPCPSPPGMLSPEPTASQTTLGAAMPADVPAPSAVLGCLSLPSGPVQSLGALPQGLWLISAGPDTSSIVICQGETPQAGPMPPAGSPAVHGLLTSPRSPDRQGSTSPFAPSAADLPALPEPALTSRADTAEDATSPTQDPRAPEGSSKLPKWPESVERFCQALKAQYQAEPEGPEATQLEVPLLKARLERVSSKSQERELATSAWAERQLAPGGLAEVLAADWHPRVLGVLGGPGQGKSHCLRALSRAWALGRLPHFDFVFRLPCRHLDPQGGPHDLRDLLGLASQGPLDAEVFRHVARRPQRVLLLLDGLEELEGPEGPPHASGPSPSEVRAPTGLLVGLLQRRLLPGCSLLLTARPRARLVPCLSKTDGLWELAGFSTEQATAFVERYFQGAGRPEDGERAGALLRAQPFLLAHCHRPAVCQALCQLLRAHREPGREAELPGTLTALYVGLLGPAVQDAPAGALVELARLAWELGRGHRGSLREDRLSADSRVWALAAGLLQPAEGPPETGAQLAFPGLLLQCFLAATWLALSTEVRDKELPQYLALTPRKKRPYDNWLEAVPRFLAGLTFQPPARGLGALAGQVPASLRVRKQRVLSRYLRRLQPGSLQPRRLVELLHCAHEAGDTGLWQHVVRGLPARLSFLGTRLLPADVHLLGRALETAERDFSLDLRNTSVGPPGLADLVGLSCVTQFRASVRDMLGLWESLQQRGEARLLRAAEEKFTIEPFQAQSPKDVEDLGHLVQRARTARELPAVRDLRKLEFALGPACGPTAFPGLVQLLEAFSSLQHLDLSQNSISDTGACKLAAALPSLAASLVRLSLYNNYICDEGAQRLALVLPDMTALRVLDVQYNKFTAAGAQQLAAGLKKSPHLETLAMWTPTIPFGVQEHLQQLDSRISLR